MKYIITVDTAGWPKSGIMNKKSLPYNDYADCFGGLEIEFLHAGGTSSYKNGVVNIPLFLTEFDDFLNRVDSASPKNWYLGFAPFAYGLLRNGSLLISARTGKAFSDGIYDTTPEDDLARLKARVAKDISLYGRVQMDVGQAGRIVSDF